MITHAWANESQRDWRQRPPGSGNMTDEVHSKGGGTDGTTSWASRKSLRGLMLTLLLCAGIRVWLVCHTEVVAKDGQVYVMMAKALSENPVQVAREFRPHPGYPAAMLAVHATAMRLGIHCDDIEGWDLCGQSVSVLSSLGATIALWAFAGMVFNWRIAWVTALLMCAGRQWAILGADVLSDALAISLELGAASLILLALRDLRRQRMRAAWFAVLVGLFVGLGYLVRPEALLLLIVANVLWLGANRGAIRWQHKLLCIAGATVTTIAFMLPYVLTTGHLTNKTDVLAVLLAHPAGAASPLAMMTAASAMILLRFLHQAADSLINMQHPALVMLMGLFGLGWAARFATSARSLKAALVAPRGEGILIMGGATVLLLGVLFLYSLRGLVISHRYLLLIAMLLSPIAGAAVVGLADWVSLLIKPSRMAWLSRFALPGFLTLIVAFLTLHSFRPLHEGKYGFRLAGQFLASVARQGDYVLSDEYWPVHYSGIEGSVLSAQEAAPDTLLKRIAQTDAKYLVLTGKFLDTASFRRDHPNLLVQLREFPVGTMANPRMAQVFRSEGHPKDPNER